MQSTKRALLLTNQLAHVEDVVAAHVRSKESKRHFAGENSKVRSCLRSKLSLTDRVLLAQEGLRAFAEVRMSLVITPLSMAYQLHGRGGSPFGPIRPSFSGDVALAMLIGSVSMMKSSSVRSIVQLAYLATPLACVSCSVSVGRSKSWMGEADNRTSRGRIEYALNKWPGNWTAGSGEK